MKRQEISAIYKDLSAYAGKTVTVCGWARSIRDSKTLGFIDLNDGRSTISRRSHLKMWERH